jgi:hypothetical protein
MRSSYRSDGLIVSDAPGCFWIFGGFFLLIGGIAGAAVVGSRITPHPLSQLLLGSVMGLLAIGAGLYFIYQSPASRVVINTSEGSITISRRGLLRSQKERHDLGTIHSVYLVQKEDIDGDPVFALRIQLQDGREVPLTLLWIHARGRLTDTLQQLSQYIPQGETRVLE